MNRLNIARVLRALGGIATAAMVAGCVETPQPTEPTPAQVEARERHREKRMAEIAAYKRRVKAEEAAAAEHEEELKRGAEEKAARYQAEKEAKRAAMAPVVVIRRSTEADEATPAYDWATKNCQLSQEDPHYVMHCDPICWRETVIQCPVFTCAMQPPTKGWVELANQRACSASRGTTNRRARAIGEHGFPPAQGPRP